jgi:hypothetical protein
VSSIATAETPDTYEPRWFDVIEPCERPWRDWFSMLQFPCHSPTDGWIEGRLVEDVCRHADRWRLAVAPATPRFAAAWATFRHHHEQLDDCYKYRRKRWLIWRGAALKVAHDHGDYLYGDFQDVADFAQCRELLAATMAEFGPVAPDGSYNGGNFWQVSTDSDGTPCPLSEYAAVVLMLVWVAVGRPRRRSRFRGTCDDRS